MITRSLMICSATLLVAAFLAGGCYHLEGPDDPQLAELLVEQGCDTVVEDEVHVRIHIDGRSWLVIQGDELWLHHFDFAAPGRHMGANHPTVVDGESWYPEWPFGPPPEEGRECYCETQDRFYLDQQLPDSGQVLVDLEVLESRGPTTLIRKPTLANGNTVVVEFDDNAPSSSVWYEVVIHWAACVASDLPAAELAI